MNATNLVISCSLNPNSKSRILAKYAQDLLPSGDCHKLLDLQDYNLPLCDGDSCYGNVDVQSIKSIIQQAKFIIMAVPIYNFGVGSSAKNLVELTGNVFKDKLIAFLCAAGGGSSYMAVMGLANSLMLDFRCLILPRFVYAKSEEFTKNQISAEIYDRIKNMVDYGLKLSSIIE